MHPKFVQLFFFFQLLFRDVFFVFVAFVFVFVFVCVCVLFVCFLFSASLLQCVCRSVFVDHLHLAMGIVVDTFLGKTTILFYFMCFCAFFFPLHHACIYCI